jgi:transposase
VSEYGGVRQRWILVDSQARRKSDIKKLDKKLEQIQQTCHQELQVLARQDFVCAADAIAVAEKLSTQMKWHQLDHIQTVEKPHYAKRGKPQPDAIPTSISYRVTATVRPIDSEILAQRHRCGRLILATNILDSLQFTADDALREYKAQQGTERHCKNVFGDVWVVRPWSQLHQLQLEQDVVPATMTFFLLSKTSLI